ncbi:hypothetical protein GALL_436870 [mine drainage metagenome]|uniref:Uncharacterized protein n=1 Tax=mine drainage metagenome TaxID=410659 RepID=A0A1J5QAY4_9ZZZZ
MHFVDIGQRAKFVGKIANLADRAEITIHRVNRFESDQHRPPLIDPLQNAAQVGHVVMLEDVLLAAAAPDALEHRGVVQRVRHDHQTGEQQRQRRKRRVIGDIGRGENQRRFFVVQVGKLCLQPLVIDRGARDIARAARPGACRV